MLAHARQPRPAFYRDSRTQQFLDQVRGAVDRREHPPGQRAKQKAAAHDQKKPGQPATPEFPHRPQQVQGSWRTEYQREGIGPQSKTGQRPEQYKQPARKHARAALHPAAHHP